MQTADTQEQIYLCVHVCYVCVCFCVCVLICSSKSFFNSLFKFKWNDSTEMSPTWLNVTKKLYKATTASQQRTAVQNVFPI